MSIPKQLLNCKFNRVLFKDKRAFEKGWQNKTYSYEEIQKHFPKENYGVICGEDLRVLDDDTPNKKLVKLFIEKFGKTFQVRDHLYFKFENRESKKIIFYDVDKNHCGELQGENTYVVGAGSTHPNGEIYDQKNNLPIITIVYDEFLKEFSDYIPSSDFNFKGGEIEDSDEKIIEEILLKWKEGDRQNLSLDFAGFLRKNKKFGFKHTQNIITEICNRAGDPDLNERLKAVKETYFKDEDDIKGYTGLKERGVNISKITKNFGEKIQNNFDKKEVAQKIIDISPCYYDKSRNWWLWDKQEFKWVLVDETDILNAVDTHAIINTVNSKEKSEILEALKQVSRKNKPEDIKTTWIQFKDKIVDIETGEDFPATAKYFITNPIPYSLETEVYSTPNMDKIFGEWVGQENIETLYEILSYCLIPDYPIHRIFCFIGGGMNGKSCFLNLLRKFIGNANCCSTELDTLLSSRFEVTRLHKKLVCQMGETNFNEMNKTSILKKLSGGDLIGLEYKNRDPFEEVNYAKIIIATNNLPTTSDKTIGFYRRWMIIDFPNQFSEKKDILAEIPESEYRSLALRCCVTLKGLLKKRGFTNEGSIDERIEKYESKSNFLEKFLKDFTIGDDINSYITKADFYKKLNGWCKEKRHREMSEKSLGSSMKKLGIETVKRHFDWLYDGKGGQLRCWGGIKWKE